jgi:Protein of unknown function (DUF2971)
MTLKELRASRPTGLLYHYTTQAGLLGIIRSRTLWATGIQYLNDTTEFRYAIELLRELADGRRFLCATLVPDPIAALAGASLPGQPEELYVASFSEHSDQLSQWRAYSRGGNGFSLGFDSSVLAPALAHLPFALLPCVYDPAIQRTLAAEFLEPHLSSESKLPHRDQVAALNSMMSFFSEVLTVAPMFKHLAFSEELEWRLASAPLPATHAGFGIREGRSTLVPYVSFPLEGPGLPFSLREVVIGPTPYPEQSRRAVSALLAHAGLSNVAIRVSTVPFRDW